MIEETSPNDQERIRSRRCWGYYSEIRGRGRGAWVAQRAHSPAWEKRKRCSHLGETQRRGGGAWRKGRWGGAKTLRAPGKERGQLTGECPKPSAQVPPECDPNVSFQLLSPTCQPPWTPWFLLLSSPSYDRIQALPSTCNAQPFQLQP